jgi:uncharacterized membrane protein YedE/YeeE
VKRVHPLYAESYERIIDRNLEKVNINMGAALFGVGWGLSGLCPGPGIINFFL